MWEDPIVADVRRAREKLSAELGHDVKAIFADLMKRQVSLGNRLVRQNKQANKKLLQAEASSSVSGCSKAMEVAPPTCSS